MSDPTLILITQLTDRVVKLETALAASANFDSKFWIPVSISIASIIVSIGIAIYSRHSTQKASQKMQNQVLLQNEKNQKQMNLQAVKTGVTIAKNEVQSIILALAPLKAKEENNTLDSDSKAELKYKTGVFNSAVEQLLNAYEDGCEKFYKDQIDKQDFMDAFHEDIIRYVKEFAEKFQPPMTSYHSTLKYYQDKHQQPKA